MGLWFELPDTPANRRGAIILLRGLHRRDGWPLVTDERLAHELGDADRRNVHHFWAEFESCGGDLAAFLQRRKKVDAEVVARCEQLWKAHPLWTCAQVLPCGQVRWNYPQRSGTRPPELLVPLLSQFVQSSAGSLSDALRIPS